MKLRHFILDRLLLKEWVLGFLLVGLAGCGRDDVRVYRVAKEQPVPAAGMPAGHPQVPVSGEGAAETAMPRLGWKLPAGWEEVPAGEMRLASFQVKGEGSKQADVGIFPLPGLAGKDLDNVNRWRGQVGQPPITEEEMAKAAEPVEIDGQKAQVYDQAGTNPGSGDKARILAAILRREGVAWFFKMNGDDAVVTQQKPAFLEFLKSVKFQAAPAAAQLPPSHPPIDSGAMAAAQGAGGGGSAEAKPQWQVPESWKEVPGGSFLVAKFQIASADDAQAAVNVSMSAGDGGGLESNVNRWRGQLGLAPLSAAELEKAVSSVDTAGGKAMFVDMTGTDGRTGQKARLVGAMVAQAGRAWFYKLMGNEQLVEREKDAFSKFVQTAKY